MYHAEPLVDSWQGVPICHDIARACAYNRCMNNNTSNPYAQQVLAQGSDLSNAPARKREFPCTIHGRVFETENDYQEAMADFLNGM